MYVHFESTTPVRAVRAVRAVPVIRFLSQSPSPPPTHAYAQVYRRLAQSHDDHATVESQTTSFLLHFQHLFSFTSHADYTGSCSGYGYAAVRRKCNYCLEARLRRVSALLAYNIFFAEQRQLLLARKGLVVELRRQVRYQQTGGSLPPLET